ncbi:hypothetical protein BGZ49_005764, partial [Haplosporangium sp. Z 27]
KHLRDPNVSRAPTQSINTTSKNTNNNYDYNYNLPHLTGDSSGLSDQSLDMPRLPFSKGLWSDNNGKSNKITSSSRTNHKSNEEPSTPDVGPPFLPPLTFGLDNISTSSFDLGDILVESDIEAKALNSNPPTPPSKDVEVVKSLQINSFRASLIQPSAGLSVISTRTDDVATTNESNIAEKAETTIRELRMELAKFSPANPLLHGTPQQEFGLLFEKNKKLSQENADLEKSIRDMYIEKDMLGMDLEAMNEELKTKEEDLVNNHTKQQSLPIQTPRMSTTHEFMKQAYLVEVKALQEQKEKLQKEIQLFMEQREAILNEMQILSVRNAELSTINNDMIKDMQGRMDLKPTSASNNKSWSDKIRRQRQLSGGNQQDLKNHRPLESSDSVLSFNSALSDENSKGHHAGDHEEYEIEIVTPKRFNWKKGTTNTVKTVGAMFGKLLVDGQASHLESSKNGHMQTDSNGLGVPTSRTFTNSSETRSLNGKYSEQHQFILHNYVRPARCEYCDDKLWGREYRCHSCGFHIHGKCLNEIIPGCSGARQDSDTHRNVTSSGASGEGIVLSPPEKRVMFGTNLTEQLEFEQRTIPLVVEKCIEAVDERGLDVEGIYRRSGMAAEARQLVHAYDIGLHPDLMDDSIYQDICSITSVLKQYFRNLPEPLVPYDLYGEFMNAISLPENETKPQTFRDLMDRMPIAHYRTMKVLLEHLNRVTKRDNINLMNAKNLSVVFGPTLMRSPDPSKEMMDTTHKNMTIEYFINHTSEIFASHEQSSVSSIEIERTSTSSIHERPSTSSSNTSASSVSNTHSSTGTVQGPGGTQSQSSTPWRTPNTSNATSPSSSGFPNIPLQLSRSASSDSTPTTLPGQAPSQSQSQSPPPPLLPQTYVPTSQYRPQSPHHQTLQQLHQKQQQLQQQQQQQLQQQQQQPLPIVQPYSYKYTPTPQQQMANPEVDMTNFP